MDKNFPAKIENLGSKMDFLIAYCFWIMIVAYVASALSVGMTFIQGMKGGTDTVFWIVFGNLSFWTGNVSLVVFLIKVAGRVFNNN